MGKYNKQGESTEQKLDLLDQSCMHFSQITLLLMILTCAIQDTKYIFQHLQSCNPKVQRSDSKMKLSYIALLPGVQLKKNLLGIQAEVVQLESRVNSQYEPLKQPKKATEKRILSASD